LHRVRTQSPGQIPEATAIEAIRQAVREYLEYVEGYEGIKET
jgi:hypothetical protein